MCNATNVPYQVKQSQQISTIKDYTNKGAFNTNTKYYIIATIYAVQPPVKQPLVAPQNKYAISYRITAYSTPEKATQYDKVVQSYSQLQTDNKKIINIPKDK